MGFVGPPSSELNSKLDEVTSKRCAVGKRFCICTSATHSGRRRSEYGISIFCTPTTNHSGNGCAFNIALVVVVCRLSNISRPDILDLHVIQYSKTWKWEIGGSTHQTTPPHTALVWIFYFVLRLRAVCVWSGPESLQSGLETGELSQPRLLCAMNDASIFISLLPVFYAGFVELLNMSECRVYDF